MDDYKEIKELLKPRRDITASDGLRDKVHCALERRSRKSILNKWLAGGISLSAVAAVLMLVFLPPGMSAREILSQAINAFGNECNIELEVEIRTRPVENFRFIDVNEAFVNHRIEICQVDTLTIWRIDKGRRIATGNGSDIFTWLPDLKLGLHLTDTDNENILGYMAHLLTPRNILQTELNNCINNKDSEYSVKKAGNDIILTVHAAPEGNFDNPYLLNSSVFESDNIRRYVIDAASKRLKSAEVSVMTEGRRIVVLRITAIRYGLQAADINRLPEDVKFIETENRLSGLRGVSAEEAASIVLNAFADWNIDILGKVMIRELSDAAYREKFQGAILVSIGHSFTSGAGNSIFVPYTLKLRDSTTQRHNIALQKNESGGWIVAGGL